MLWAFATLGPHPNDALVAGLNARALEAQGGFNSQSIAITLWVLRRWISSPWMCWWWRGRCRCRMDSTLRTLPTYCGRLR